MDQAALMLCGTYGEPPPLSHARQTVGKYMHQAALVLCGIGSKLPPLSPAQQTVHGFMHCAALMMCTTNGKPQLLSSAQQTVGKYTNHVALMPCKTGSGLPPFSPANQNKQWTGSWIMLCSNTWTKPVVDQEAMETLITGNVWCSIIQTDNEWFIICEALIWSLKLHNCTDVYL